MIARILCNFNFSHYCFQRRKFCIIQILFRLLDFWKPLLLLPLVLRLLLELRLSRERGGSSKWCISSVISSNGGRPRMPYVVGRSLGFFPSIIFSNLNYTKWKEVRFFTIKIGFRWSLQCHIAHAFFYHFNLLHLEIDVQNRLEIDSIAAVLLCWCAPFRYQTPRAARIKWHLTNKCPLYNCMVGLVTAPVTYINVFQLEPYELHKVAIHLHNHMASNSHTYRSLIQNHRFLFGHLMRRKCCLAVFVEWQI